MKLLEYEGKAMLANHGVPLPAGALWPEFLSAPTGWVVKAQVLAGGRGKRGGILTARRPRRARSASRRSCTAASSATSRSTAVYIEQKLEIAQRATTSRRWSTAIWARSR